MTIRIVRKTRPELNPGPDVTDHPACDGDRLRDLIHALENNGHPDFPMAVRRGPCLVWQGGTDGEGYAWNNGGRLHTSATDALIGRKNRQGRIVRHRCGDRRCVNPEHWMLGTHQDNAADREAHGRTAKGERHPNAKLSDAQRNEIRESYRPGETGYKKLAKLYGVSPTAIKKIVKDSARMVRV